jgi:hypothetical protein
MIGGDFKRRLRRLEQQRELDCEKCRECGTGAADIRELVNTLHPAFCPGWEPPPLPPRPPEDLCIRCGRPKTIRFTESWPPDQFIIHGPYDSRGTCS